MAKPWAAPDEYGLHRLDDGCLHDIAAPVWHWDRYYELIVRSLLHGSWETPLGNASARSERAVSYWYGMSSGVIGVKLAEDLPYASKKLIDLLRSGIVSGAIHPFEGELRSQQGVVQAAGMPPLSSTDVVGMTWLADTIDGSFPKDWEISERARAAAQVAGIPGALGR